MNTKADLINWHRARCREIRNQSAVREISGIILEALVVGVGLAVFATAALSILERGALL